ncbi:TolC family protein [Phorcysia thermohydrogeniphila]|uniref:Outer membrane protein TolC n=1 Tax=Phorcysia thermohydrogeniphila TaxID=936138 RepID=A0A4R1GB59_9BACT|nr:TolC family protein [Phorcysia thermohydrogeniphila]TCK02869.1 outer membrane protein TolC [Phorcysia thermohydrogeniphila]
MKLSTLAVVLFFLFSSAKAITLKEAEELAVKNYPQLEALSLKSEGLKKRALSTKLFRLGEVNLILDLRHFDKEYLLVPMSSIPLPLNRPPFDRDKLSWGIDYSIPLYLGGNTARQVKVLKLRSEILENLKESTKWQLKFNVDSVFLSYLALDEVERALKDYRKSLERLKESIEAGISAGKFAKVDLLKVTSQIKSTEARIDEVRAKKESLKTALEILIGKEVETVEAYEVSYAPVELSLNELYRKLVKNNSLLKAKEKEVRVSEREKEIEEGKFGLKVKAEIFYTRNYGFNSSENEGYGYAGVTLSYPVFEFGRKRLSVLSAKLQKLARIKELETEKLKLKKELSESLSDLRAIQSKIGALKEKLKLAEEVERIEELKYKSGKGDINHLLLAKSERFLTEAELKEAYYRWEIARRRIRALLEEK